MKKQNMYVLTKEKTNAIEEIKLTDKGCFYYLAMRYGLCPKTIGGYDTSKLDKVWEEYENWLSEKEKRDSLENKTYQAGNYCAANSTKDCYLPVLFALLGVLIGSVVGNLLFLLVRVMFFL